MIFAIISFGSIRHVAEAANSIEVENGVHASVPDDSAGTAHLLGYSLVIGPALFDRRFLGLRRY